MLNPPTQHKRDVVSLAGWLFADLLLALSVIFLVSTPTNSSLSTTVTPTRTETVIAYVKPIPTFEPSSTPTVVPTPALTPTPTPTLLPATIYVSTRVPPGLGEAQCYNVELKGIPTGDAEVESAYKQLVNQLPNSTDVQAGLALVWVHGKTVQDGASIAGRINEMIKARFELSFGEAKFKSLGFAFGDDRHTQIEVYFLSTSPWISKNGSEVTCEYTQ